MANGQQATRVVTGLVRLSYCHLFEPYSSDPGEQGKYSTVILIPKTDKVTIRKLKQAQEAAIEAGISSRWNGKRPKNLTSTIHDGDEEADLDRNPEYEGHLYMTVSSKNPPGVLDKNKVEIMDSQAVYSGCYALVSINAFPYSVSGNNGVSFGLNHVMKIKDGANLGGRSRAEDDFADVDTSQWADDDDEDDSGIF